jgi:1-aminocyclopropane-1-carboxylate deaminase/D-cysteine desulfhydrase-like pyridoxal-dependent ACC family enzyme
VLKHVSPRIAAGFGAYFEYAKGPYNPILQKKVEELTRSNSLVVHYGITVDHMSYPAEIVREFHEVGANQTKNIPNEVDTLIMPTGSCNSICSVILGLSKDPKNIRRVVAMEIGPDKREWLWNRLAILGVVRDKLPFKVKYITLHGEFSKYTDHFKETFDGIKFHPVYEAKMWRWLIQHGGITPDSKILFWIVGGEPDVKVLEPFYTNQIEEVA